MAEMFVRLCPLCNLRSKSGNGVKPEPAVLPHSVGGVGQ